MPAKRDTSDFREFETILPKGARSRYDKLCRALDEADTLIPDDALSGSSDELRQAMMRIHTAMTNLAELLAYRKMLGVD